MNNIELTSFSEYGYYADGAIEEYIVGSAKYPRQLATPNDVDRVFVVSDRLFNNINEIYTYKDGLIDNIIVSKTKFDKSRLDGSDILMFEANPVNPTKKVVLAYIGIAKRDLKDYIKTGREDKLYHYLRCKNIASYLAGHDLGGDFTGAIRFACLTAEEETEYFKQYPLDKETEIDGLNRLKEIVRGKE